MFAEELLPEASTAWARWCEKNTHGMLMNERTRNCELWRNCLGSHAFRMKE